MVDQEGNIIGAIESMRDISAWKMARETLRDPGYPKADIISGPDHEAIVIKEASDREINRLGAALDLIPDAILILEGSGQILHANNAFLELVKGKKDVIIGAHLSIFLPPENSRNSKIPGMAKRINATSYLKF